MTLERGLLGLFSWFARHLVAFGFLTFVVVGWIWREHIFPAGFDWRGLVESLRSSESVAIDVPPRAEVPKGTFRPTIPGLRVPVLRHEPENLLASARRAFWLGEYAEAERLYRDHVAEYPRDVDGYGELGNLLLGIGRVAEALTAYQSAIGLLEERQRMTEAAELRAGVENLRPSDSDVVVAEQ